MCMFHVWVYVPVRLCRSQRSTSVVIPLCYPPSKLETQLLISLDFIKLARKLRGSVCLHIPSTRITNAHHHAWLLVFVIIFSLILWEFHAVHFIIFIFLSQLLPDRPPPPYLLDIFVFFLCLCLSPPLVSSICVAPIYLDVGRALECWWLTRGHYFKEGWLPLSLPAGI